MKLFCLEFFTNSDFASRTQNWALKLVYPQFAYLIFIPPFFYFFKFVGNVSSTKMAFLQIMSLLDKKVFSQKKFLTKVLFYSIYIFTTAGVTLASS